MQPIILATQQNDHNENSNELNGNDELPTPTTDDFSPQTSNNLAVTESGLA